MKTNLLLYSHGWFPQVGGVQTVTLSLATGLAEWGNSHPDECFEIILVTQTPANGADDSRFPFRVVRRPKVLELIRYIRSADILHLAGPALLPMLFAWFLGTPAVVEHHGYHSICPNGLLLYAPDQSICPGHFQAKRYRQCIRCNAKDLGWSKSFLNLLLTFPRRWLCQRVAGNIAVTHHVARRIALPRTHTIYHGIHDAYGASAPPLSSSPLGSQLRIAYVGRLVQEKGLPLLLEAAKQLKKDGISFQLTFVGDGPQRAELEASTRLLDLQDRVTFTGKLTGPDLNDALQAVQVVVMPSQWEETAGLAAMEQMMRGGAVVAADIGGLGEIVDDSGLKFPPGDSMALAACLRRLAENPVLITELGVAAHRRALQVFALDGMIQGHVRIYQAAILL